MTRLVLALMLVVALPNCAQPLAQEKDTWTPHFENADLFEFIQLVQVATQKTFVIDPRVKGQVTVVNDKALDRQQLYDLLLATLEVNGFTAVEVDSIVRIIPAVEVKTKPVPQPNLN